MPAESTDGRVQRPLAYLDVDDTILRHPTPDESVAPPGADRFLRFLATHFEVRWLTRWCPGGRMTPDQITALGEFLRVAPDELEAIVNPGRFVDRAPPEGMPSKWRALDWDAIEAGRPFVWIENALAPEDRAVLERRGLLDSYVECDVTARPARLPQVEKILRARFGFLAPGED